MNKVKTVILAAVLALTGAFVTVKPVSACDPKTDAQCMKICDMDSIDDAQKEAAGCNTKKDANVVNNVVNIIDVAIAVVGILAVIVIILAGVRMVTSAGDPKKISEAKNAVLYSGVALVVALLAYAIVNFVAGSIGK